MMSVVTRVLSLQTTVLRDVGGPFLGFVGGMGEALHLKKVRPSEWRITFIAVILLADILCGNVEIHPLFRHLNKNN